MGAIALTVLSTWAIKRPGGNFLTKRPVQTANVENGWTLEWPSFCNIKFVLKQYVDRKLLGKH